MFSLVRVEALPEKSLLARYNKCDKKEGYTDCYTIDLNRQIHFSNFVEAFYTSPLFKIERFVLSLIGRSSNDKKAKELALGLRDDFAAWTVEDRSENQILLCDFMEKTRSWLMVEFSSKEDQSKLYFGSAVVFKSSGKSETKPPMAFSLLSRFHVFYSKALLTAAYRRLVKSELNN